MERKTKQLTGTVGEDLARILSIPVLSIDGARCTDPNYEKDLYNLNTPDKTFKLRQKQIDGVWTFEREGGLLSPLGVGAGKTWLSLLIARVAHLKRKHRKSVLMVPPTVISQLTLRDLPQGRRLLDLDPVAFYPVIGSAEKRKAVATSGLPGCYILTYSTLSTASGYETLKAIGATCYILDEAQNLARSTAARTKRWISAVSEIEAGLGQNDPQIEVAAMSGTITRKSIADYAHIARAALREGSPLPISHRGIEEWSAAIDADRYTTSSSAHLFRLLVQWALVNGAQIVHPESAPLTVQEVTREAHQHRLRSAPGVVATVNQSVDCGLLIRWREPQMPDTTEGRTMKDLMAKVVDEDITPDGDDLDWAMHRYKWLWELTSGFYNSLIWPDAATLAAKRTISALQADTLLQQAKLHHKLLQTYHKQLREFLAGTHVPGCDTPLLVGSVIKRKIDGQKDGPKVPSELIDAWQAAQQAWFDDLPSRQGRPVRICDYRIKEAVLWAKEAQDGLIWYHHPAIGEWVSEYLTLAGIPHTYAPAGDNEAAFKPGLVVLSMTAHGTGKNLQHQRRQLFVEWRREASQLEQILGRTHRPGQQADEVEVDVFLANGFDLSQFSACLIDADYIQSTTGQQQKLCFATYDPIIPPVNPRIYAKLGILDHVPSSVRVGEYGQITPMDLKTAADLFRPMAYTKQQ